MAWSQSDAHIVWSEGPWNFLFPAVWIDGHPPRRWGPRHTVVFEHTFTWRPCPFPETPDGLPLRLYPSFWRINAHDLNVNLTFHPNGSQYEAAP